VNGEKIKPVMEKGYAVITRQWKAGDKIALELPLQVQRITADSRIESTRGKVALRYGPLVYNIESRDQDIAKPLDATSPLKTEWRGDLLGGLNVITGKFTDGSSLQAIPNFARVNRDKELPPEAGPLAADPSFYLGPTAQQPGQQQASGQRRGPRPVASLVWMRQT
jgi:hypothetical protein